MEYTQEQEYDKQLDISLWKHLLRYARPYYKNLVKIMLFMVLCAACDAVLPLMNAYAIDRVIGEGYVEGMGWLVPAYIVHSLVAALMTYCFIREAGLVEVGVCYSVRERGIKRLQQLSFTFYDRTPVGYLMARMTSDVQRIADTIGWTLVDLVWASVMIIFCSVVMLIKNWRLALICLAVIPLLAVVSLFFQKHILKNHRLVRKTNSQITGAFNEGIQGAKTTKTLVREQSNFEEFKTLTSTMRRASVRATVISAVYMPIVACMASVATALVLWKGGYDVFDGELSLGTLTIFLTYSASMFEPVQNIARIFSELQSSQAAAERVISLIETEPDIVDSPEVVAKYGDQFDPKREAWEPISGRVDFEGVDFAYKGGEAVLHDFSLHVEPGQKIALVGETGAGKSTIVNLVCRFYEPTAGRVLIDGVDYRERSQLWLQSRLGYVLQSPHLFSGTVADNIRYGRMDATDEQVRRAAEMVGADRFVEKLEKGYDTNVGEGGSRLSTGEKQLISFARALIADPAIFVLDEATSSIDTETESLIQAAINKTLEGRTSFIVAHRLSTIRSADRILVIHDGRIIEDGTHAQLLQLGGRYYQLYTNQFREEQAAELIGRPGKE